MRSAIASHAKDAENYLLLGGLTRSCDDENGRVLGSLTRSRGDCRVQGHPPRPRRESGEYQALRRASACDTEYGERQRQRAAAWRAAALCLYDMVAQGLEPRTSAV